MSGMTKYPYYLSGYIYIHQQSLKLVFISDVRSLLSRPDCAASDMVVILMGEFHFLILPD